MRGSCNCGSWVNCHTTLIVYQSTFDSLVVHKVPLSRLAANEYKSIYSYTKSGQRVLHKWRMQVSFLSFQRLIWVPPTSYLLCILLELCLEGFLPLLRSPGAAEELLNAGKLVFIAFDTSSLTFHSNQDVAVLVYSSMFSISSTDTVQGMYCLESLYVDRKKFTW